MLFTDIEGSTRLLQQVGDRYAEVVATCRQLLRAVFQRWHGHEVDTQGDSFFVAFARPTDAVWAVVEMQHTLATHAWLDGITARMRIGLHTGQPLLSSEGYVGLDVHHAARIMSVGHGGQVLLSVTTQELVKHDLPDGVSLRDLGEYRLKDLQHPSRLFQLVIANLPADFPPLKTLDSHPNNLPIQPTALIGREQEVAAVKHLLCREDIRLVTLTGPGGIGKTRLGLQVAAELSDRFPDGVYFVNLAPLSDHAFVVPTIAQAFDIKEIADHSLLDLLKAYLREKRLLLLLDNFEQVVGAAVQVSDLLATCPNLKVVVTSRAALHLRGEQEFAVPPLAVPNPKHLPDLVALSQYETVALFIMRAQAVKPAFQVTNANAQAVAEICVRLDGLPLAIELAAARVKVLSPQALLARLDRRLHILTGGARDLPERQRTLRNTLAWSYELLTVEEQRLFRRLSVFVGGCTLEAIEAICSALPEGAGHVFEGVASLLDKSLLQQTEQERAEPRLTMLETIREYGLECLRESEETPVCQQVHALYFLALAEEAEPKLIGAEHVNLMERLEQEHDNLLATLGWLLEQNEMELLLRLSGALRIYWEMRGYFSEGRRWIESGLEGRNSVSTPVQAKAFYSVGMLAAIQSDNESARVQFAESLRLYRVLEDQGGVAAALSALGYVTCSIDHDAEGCAMLEESLALSRVLGDRYRMAEVLAYLGNVAEWRDEYSKARTAYEESLILSQELIDHEGMHYVLAHLANIDFVQGEYKAAYVRYTESLMINEAVGHRRGIATLYHLLARVFLYQGDFAQAYPLAEHSLLLSKELATKGDIAASLTILGQLAYHQRNFAAAHTFLEESVALYQEIGNRQRIAHSLSSLARVVFSQGANTRARALYMESFTLHMQATARTWHLAECLEGLGQVLAAQEECVWAAQIWGVAERLREAIGAPMPPLYLSTHESTVAVAHTQCGEKAFAAALVQGRTMKPEQALAGLQRASLPEPVSAAKQPTSPTSPNDLTTREMDVLRLLAQGLTSAQIAERLVIGLVTVNSHVRSIYSKLGVTSRAAATRYALEHHLL